MASVAPPTPLQPTRYRTPRVFAGVCRSVVDRPMYSESRETPPHQLATVPVITWPKGESTVQPVSCFHPRNAPDVAKVILEDR